MREIQFLKENRQNFMAVFYEEEIEENYALTLLTKEKIPYFLSLQKRELNGKKGIYYALQYGTTLQDVIEQVSPSYDVLCQMIQSIVGVLREVYEYLLEEGNIFWQPNRIFMEANSGRLLFGYNLVSSGENGTVKELLSYMLEHIDKHEEQGVLLLLQFYNLITEPDCTMKQLQEYCRNKGMREEKEFEEVEFLPQPKDLPIHEDMTITHNEKRKEIAGIKKGWQEAFEASRDKIVFTNCVILGLLDMVLLFGVMTGKLPPIFTKGLFGGIGLFVLLLIFALGKKGDDDADQIMKEYLTEKREEVKKAQQAVTVSVPEYGETTVLKAPGKEETVKETREGNLCLIPASKEELQPIKIGSQNIVIGCMEEGCNYVLPEKGISRMHAKLFKKPDGLFVMDLNSTNGTYLNGEGIQSGQEYPLEEGDVLSFALCEFYVVRE